MKNHFLFRVAITVASVFICIGNKATAQNLIASYPLNGNANDVSGNALNGVINGPVIPVAETIRLNDGVKQSFVKLVKL